MPRILRSSLPDGFFHVTSRGVDGCPIYRDDDDRVAFLALLALCVRLYGWKVHVFCLMTNHYHLIVETTVRQLSAGMQLLNGEHAAAFNLKYGRKGHLFGGRFHSWVIEDEEHLANAIAYVLANPVRAGICANPDDYRWSAARDDLLRKEEQVRPPGGLGLRHQAPGARGPREPRRSPQPHRRRVRVQAVIAAYDAASCSPARRRPVTYAAAPGSRSP